MNKYLVVLVISGILPPAAEAADLAGEALEFYLRLQASLDAVDKDSDSSAHIASESSRVGFRGTLSLADAYAAFYQLEAEVSLNGGGGATNRNSFVGLEGAWGRVLVGQRDTPLRDLRDEFELFDDTVGDSRSVFGASGGFDVRARRAIMYSLPEIEGLELDLMHAIAWDADGLPGRAEDRKLTSVRAGYTAGGFRLTVAAETQSPGSGLDDREALRAAAVYTVGDSAFGGIWENLKPGHDEQTGYGANVAHRVGATTLKLQLLFTEESDRVSDNGASMLTIGADHALSPAVKLFAMYARVDNDDNAEFQIAGGHDNDKYMVTHPGDDIEAVSVGFAYRF